MVGQFSAGEISGIAIGNLIAVQKLLTAIENLVKVLAAQYPSEVVAVTTPAMTLSDHAHMPSGASREPTVQVAFLPTTAPRLELVYQSS